MSVVSTDRARSRPRAAGAGDPLAGGGELGALMRAYDWRSSPLGPPASWPQSLKTAVRIMLTSRQPMWLGWGPELTYLYNDAYRSIIGGKHPWALGQPVEEVWRELRDQIGPMLATAMGGVEGTYVEAQQLIMERNGYPEETYYTFSYSPVPDDEGEPGGIICANTDDTQRVIGQRQLTLLGALAAETADARTPREACERAAAVLGRIPNDAPFAVIYMADHPGAEMALIGASGVASGHPAAPARLEAGSDVPWPIGQAFRSGAPVLVKDAGARFDQLLPSGPWSRPPSQAVVLPIEPVGESGPCGALVVGLNPFRLYDESYDGFLKLVAGQITTAVTNATAYEEERRRAEALAELDRAKTLFFSNVSHEFRTPLTLMLGPLEDVLAKPDDDVLPDNRRLVETAHRNGQRLLKLVNNLLDFSRIEAGRVKAAFEPLDLAAFTAELASSFRSATDRAGLRLEVDAPPLPQPVYVDREMWEKVVLNLVSNAFKFTLEGAITVAVRPAPEGDGVEVEVRDTGVGVPPEELPRLFERFHRVEGARGRTVEGSGIGLALVSELVRLHGGRIEVESRPGVGTAFRIRLPYGATHLAGEQVRPAAEPGVGPVRALAFVDEALRWLPGEAAGAPWPVSGEIVGEAAETPPAAAAGARVLLADDNADMRAYLARLLTARGYRVTAVADGRAALEAARQAAPDLILTDVMMPDLDGFALLQAVRKSPELADIPVILLSARAGEEARVEGMNAGADDYLVKPFSARELLARVSANLQLAGMRREAAEALREEARALELLNQVGSAVAAELDLNRAVQAVTDAATELSGAAYGSFFYNVIDDQGESYTLYALSGAPREAFSKFPMPRNTAVFGPTFAGEGVVRSDDITRDPRYGHNPPHHGQPEGHLKVCSYLAAPVVSRSGEVLGGLFFGHPEPGVFTARAERIVVGIAAQAAIAIDNARLYQAAQTEIARRAETEAALRESEELLERKVDERTGELAAANRELLAQIEERERVEATLRQMQRLEAVGQLTSGVAHDFNNLLTVVLGSIEFLERDPLSDLQRRRLALAREAGERGAKLTAQLLAFSRRQRLEPKAVNLNETVEAMRELLQSTLGGAVHLDIDLGEDLWSALVDPTQIELVILNLAINARDAMTVGGTIRIETRNLALARAPRRPEEPDPGEYVVIAVRDDGAGMSPEVARKAFEPFFTTKPVGKGSGLGLAQVYGFAKQSGGGVALATAPGEGTCVEVYLPRTDGAGRREAGRERRAAPTFARGLVLLVDDDPAVREIEADCLRAAGFEVLEAGSAGAALELVGQRADIEAAVVDFAMPGMNGAEAARQLRARRPDLPVLFVTGYGDLDQLAHVGEDRIVQKPFRPEELTAKVEHLLRLAAG
jgi:signal transduction histidine kinase/DNA-binding response OmpR family regulator